MVNQDAVSYIRKELVLGKTESEVKKSLLDTGYTQVQVDEAFVALAERVDDSASGGDKKGKEVAKFIVLGGVVFMGLSALVGGIVVAYETVYMKPERALKRVSEQIMSAEDYVMDTKFDLKFEVEEIDKSDSDDVMKNLAGGFIETFANGKFESSFHTVVDNSSESRNIHLTASNFIDVFVFNNIDFDFEMLLVENKTYFKLSKKLPLLPINFDEIKDKWILFERDEKTDIEQNGLFDKYFKGIDDGKTQEIQKIFKESGALVLEKQRESFFRTDLTRGYVVSLDKEKLETFKDTVKESVGISDDLESLVNDFGKLSEFEFRYRVGMFDSELKSFELKVKSEPSELGLVYIFNLTSTISEFNMGSRVEAPDDAVSLIDLVGETISPATNSAKLKETVNSSQVDLPKDASIPTTVSEPIIVNSNDTQPTSNNNEQRQADLSAILDAVVKFTTDNGNIFPDSIGSLPTSIGTDVGLVNLELDLVPGFLESMPFDPSKGSEKNTQYMIYFSNQGRLIGEATGENGTKVIRVVR